MDGARNAARTRAQGHRNQPPEMQPPATPLPWFAQGPLIHGPDQGGIDIGPVIGQMGTKEDAQFVVNLVNRQWRRNNG